MNFESGRSCTRYHLRFASRTLPCGRNALYGDSFHPLLRSTNTVRFALRIAARVPDFRNGSGTDIGVRAPPLITLVQHL